MENGITQGVVFTDKVRVGNATYERQAVQAATYVDLGFPDDHTTDGILGLGFRPRNHIIPEPQNTFFENIQSSLEQPLFTAYLQDNTGSFDFGFINTTKYKGDISYTSVDASEGYWSFTAASYSINRSKINTPVKGVAGTWAFHSNVIVYRNY